MVFGHANKIMLSQAQLSTGLAGRARKDKCLFQWDSGIARLFLKDRSKPIYTVERNVRAHKLYPFLANSWFSHVYMSVERLE